MSIFDTIVQGEKTPWKRDEEGRDAVHVPVVAKDLEEPVTIPIDGVPVHVHVEVQDPVLPVSIPVEEMFHSKHEDREEEPLLPPLKPKHLRVISMSDEVVPEIVSEPSHRTSLSEEQVKPQEQIVVSRDHFLTLETGQDLQTLDDLDKALETMTMETWNKHVGKGKNDFATWISHVFNDVSLAQRAWHSNSPKELRDVFFV